MAGGLRRTDAATTTAKSGTVIAAGPSTPDGPLAEAIAAEDAEAAAACRAAIARRPAQRALVAEVEAVAAQVADLTDALVAATLLDHRPPLR